MSRSQTSFSLNAFLSRFSIALGGALIGVMPLQAVSLATAQEHSSDRPLLIAQKIQNYCLKQESLFFTMETKSYWVSICGSGDTPYTYVGVSKKNPRQSIRVPLKESDPQGKYFRAVNKEFDYILAQTPKGKFLTVTNTKTKLELLRETVLRGW